MSTPSTREITQLLVDWSKGDRAAVEKLMPLVHDELRRLARRYMARERRDHTLQTSALVNEAYLRLVGWENARWENRAHFFGMSAQLMRRILVDHARARGYAKRGGGAAEATLGEAADVAAGRTADLVALDDALKALEELSPRQSQVVELRYFGGLSLEETAELLGVSVGTVRRDWSLAKAWLYAELSVGGGDDA